MRRTIGAAILMHFQASLIITITRQFVLTTEATRKQFNVVNAYKAGMQEPINQATVQLGRGV